MTQSIAHIADFQRLLAGVGLGDEHLVDIDPDARGVNGIEGVLGIDEGNDTAQRLSLRENLQGERCLAA